MRLFRSFVVALVVALVPSLAFAQTQSFNRGAINGTATAGASTQNVCLNTAGLGSIGISIQGTVTATLSFWGSGDGTNYLAWLAEPTQTGPAGGATSGVGVAGATSKVLVAPVAGLRRFCVNASAYTSGTATVTLTGVTSSQTVEPLGSFGQPFLQQAPGSSFSSVGPVLAVGPGVADILEDHTYTHGADDSAGNHFGALFDCTGYRAVEVVWWSTPSATGATTLNLGVAIASPDGVNFQQVPIGLATPVDFHAGTTGTAWIQLAPELPDTAPTFLTGAQRLGWRPNFTKVYWSVVGTATAMTGHYQLRGYR